jgi:hypothetical protein
MMISIREALFGPYSWLELTGRSKMQNFSCDRAMASDTRLVVPPKYDKVRAAKRMVSGAVRNVNVALQHAHSFGDRLPEEGKRVDWNVQSFPG